MADYDMTKLLLLQYRLGQLERCSLVLPISHRGKCKHWGPLGFRWKQGTSANHSRRDQHRRVNTVTTSLTNTSISNRILRRTFPPSIVLVTSLLLHGYIFLGHIRRPDNLKRLVPPCDIVLLIDTLLRPHSPETPIPFFRKRVVIPPPSSLLPLTAQLLLKTLHPPPMLLTRRAPLLTAKLVVGKSNAIFQTAIISAELTPLSSRVRLGAVRGDGC